MNPDISSFENLVFNLVNVETVLLSEVENSDGNFFKESLADLDTNYFFSEKLADYLQSTSNKSFFILHLNI